MKAIFLLAVAALFFCSCNSKSGAGKPLCDTTCKSDQFTFNGDEQFRQTVTISVNGCNPDSLTWTNGKTLVTRQIQLADFLNKPVRMNKAAIAVAFQDTTLVWLSFNDCITGRGYLLKLPYSKGQTTQKITSALNNFDPKFVVDEDLRAYTDEGNIYVENVKTGKMAQMTFKEKYAMDFNKIHEVVDSIHVTKDRVFVKLLKDGKDVPFEKKIEL
jgi:hypothetical protein